MIGQILPTRANSNRLILYVAAIAGVALLAAYGYHRWSSINKELELAQTRLQLAEQANQASQQTIKSLMEQRARDTEALAGLAADVAAIRRTTGATHTAIKDLGVANEDVREYLLRPVPDPLRGVLNTRAAHSD